MNCDRLWNPESEEQRYCWACDMWFHATCLEESIFSKQEAPVASGIPEVILEVALQPTARGGPLHFATGNVRIVKFAHDLLKPEVRDAIITNHNWFVAHSQEFSDGENDNIITNEDWRSFMEDEHGMKEKERGDNRFEQLVIYGQAIFICPSCKGAI